MQKQLEGTHILMSSADRAAYRWATIIIMEQYITRLSSGV